MNNVLIKYQKNLWAKSKYAELFTKSIERKTILNIFKTKRERKENIKDFTRFLRVIGVAKFNISKSK